MPTSSEGSSHSFTDHTESLFQEDVDMDLTMCGLLVDKAEKLARLYEKHGDWNEVEEAWFEERVSERSTKSSSRKILRILSSRFKHAPPSLPKPSDLPQVLEQCETTQEKHQVLYFYLVNDDALFRYTVKHYAKRLLEHGADALDFSNESLHRVLYALTYENGTEYGYAESTTNRWCRGYRSVMRDIGVIENQNTVTGTPPSLGGIPLLVSLGFSYKEGGSNWVESPLGLMYLFQPSDRWQELYDRVARMDSWEMVEVHSSLRLQPVQDVYSWIPGDSE